MFEIMFSWCPAFVRNLSASWFKIPISYRGVLVITLPTLCTLATLLLWVWIRQLANPLNARIQQNYTQSQNSAELLTLLLNAETGVRGYVLTQEDQFLEPYRLAQQHLPSMLESLSTLEGGIPQNTSLEAISKLVRLRLRNLEHQIQLTQTNTTKATQGSILLEQGKTLMDTLRQDIGHLKTLQKQTLANDQEKLENVRDIATSIQQLMSVVSLLSFVGAIYLFRQLESELNDREQQLFQSKTLIEAVTSNILDGVLTINPYGKIETFNPAISHLFQYKETDLLGQHITKLWSDATKFKYADPSQSFIEKIFIGEPWQTMAYRQDGSTFPVEISISETQIKKQLIVFIRDVTERAQSEAQLKSQSDQLVKLNLTLIRSNAELKRKNTELETITYVTAHDLKTPLRGIATLSEWIEDDLGEQLPIDTRRQLQLLKSRVHRLTNLINELLDYSRIGSNKSVIEQVAVKDLLLNITKSLSPPDGITLTIGKGMPIFKTAKDLLKKVFFQLIENSILHHDLVSGNINITVKERFQEYEFIVADDGPGIAPEYYQKVFTVFQVLDRRDDTQQTGIGLAMVKKIIETTGGEIWMEKNGDRGLAVHFTWAKNIK